MEHYPEQLLTEERAQLIENNLAAITERIEAAAKEAGRDPASIKLLLATKTRTPAEINHAINLGYGLIGENRAQELSAKYPAIQEEIKGESITPRESHFIGALQGNKVAEVTALAHCIQSVDRLRIARRIHNYCITNHLKRQVMIQVNTSREPQKGGVMPEELFPFLESLKEFDRLEIKGLMTIGLQSQNTEKVREGFALLRELLEEAKGQNLLTNAATELSMGMSGDLELAILEGATIIRIGSAIFGEREEK